MNPAYSVIVFTTSSGAGYGLLVWLAIAFVVPQWRPEPTQALIGMGLALGLISAGLLASTAHLGHPERAWRALSQWRSSWLSREGVVALATYLPALGFAWAWYRGETGGWWTWAAASTAALSLLTVICTAMIYGSLKPIPRWRNRWVVPGYLGFCLATGALLFAALMAGAQQLDPAMVQATAVALSVAWLIKLAYWREVDQAPATATASSAIGVPDYPRVRLFESPHTSDNFVLREMGYRVARKHAGKLRRIALAGAVASLSLVLASPNYEGTMQAGWVILAAVIGLVSVAIERWLFFAEARHLVTLYYGEQQV